MSYVPTVKIKVKPCKGNEEGVVVMNEADYDPKKHELYDPAKVKKVDKVEEPNGRGHK